jgi:hypothetical protein
MLPTMLVYQSGELVHNWVRVDWELRDLDIESLLDKCVFPFPSEQVSDFVPDTISSHSVDPIQILVSQVTMRKTILILYGAMMIKCYLVVVKCKP